SQGSAEQVPSVGRAGTARGPTHAAGSCGVGQQAVHFTTAPGFSLRRVLASRRLPPQDSSAARAAPCGFGSRAGPVVCAAAGLTGAAWRVAESWAPSAGVASGAGRGGGA